MSETNTELLNQIKDIINYNLKQIISYPEELVLTEEIGDNSIVITIKAHKDDRGKVIGKNGNLIRSIRTIVRAVASQEKVRTVITMID